MPTTRSRATKPLPPQHSTAVEVGGSDDDDDAPPEEMTRQQAADQEHSRKAAANKAQVAAARAAAAKKRGRPGQSADEKQGEGKGEDAGGGNKRPAQHQPADAAQDDVLPDHVLAAMYVGIALDE
jgi:hypothetical protein